MSLSNSFATHPLDRVWIAIYCREWIVVDNNLHCDELRHPTTSKDHMEYLSFVLMIELRDRNYF